jgi:hypothetical protein
MTATDTAITTRQELHEQLAADGMTPGRPHHAKPDCIAIDREVASAATCEECAHVGLDFTPYRRADGTSGYRCMASCSCCDAAFEF